MQTSSIPCIRKEKHLIKSEFLERDVTVDCYIPEKISEKEKPSLLLINDGQDLPDFQFERMLSDLLLDKEISPVFCVGIHCGKERRMEYGTANIVDYKGRGVKAAYHKRFLFEELLPILNTQYFPLGVKEKAYAGFSLGGLTAIDISWAYPEEFSRVGVFSGSFWWRLKALDNGYVEETDRIMHKLIREGNYKPGLKFYFTTGSKDEIYDRNNNGIIDSIDDTLGLIRELEKKGYKRKEDFEYINYVDGSHDVKTWGRAMPDFLRWGWGIFR